MDPVAFSGEAWLAGQAPKKGSGPNTTTMPKDSARPHHARPPTFQLLIRLYVAAAEAILPQHSRRTLTDCRWHVKPMAAPPADRGLSGRHTLLNGADLLDDREGRRTSGQARFEEPGPETAQV